jgi:hypothetical protein
MSCAISAGPACDARTRCRPHQFDFQIRKPSALPRAAHSGASTPCLCPVRNSTPWSRRFTVLDDRGNIPILRQIVSNRAELHAWRSQESCSAAVRLRRKSLSRDRQSGSGEQRFEKRTARGFHGDKSAHPVRLSKRLRRRRDHCRWPTNIVFGLPLFHGSVVARRLLSLAPRLQRVNSGPRAGRAGVREQAEHSGWAWGDQFRQSRTHARALLPASMDSFVASLRSPDGTRSPPATRGISGQHGRSI